MILITGATGLLGSRLLLDLRLQGKKCRVLLRSNSSKLLIESTFRNNPELLDEIDWFYGDILDVISLGEAMTGILHVYHCAATVSFNPAAKDHMMHLNVEGTANVLNTAIDMGVVKFCHVSSIAAIGRDDELKLINEKTSWTRKGKNSNYAISKYSAEAEVWRAVAEGLDVIVVNPGIILGPGDWEKDSSRIFSQAYKGLMFYTYGRTGFVDVRDVSNVMIDLMESEIKNERFIVVSENLPFRTIFDLINYEFNIPRPKIGVGKLMSSLIWRLEKLRALITGNSPLITKETARSANGVWEYENQKIKNKLSYNFIPISKSIKETCRIFLEQKKIK